MNTQTSQQLAAAIAALEAQRALLGDAVVDTALAPLREKLAALRAPEIAATGQQLKQVSVLFVGVIAPTEMGRQLELETIHEVMDRALERFGAVVRAEGGRVLRYAGEGMLAAFGTETAREDDVEAAIRAGLGIVEEARHHALEVLRDQGVEHFDVRVGVHTGQVLLGGGIEADRSISGASVNLAAHIERSAPPGRVRISHASWRHVRGLFEFEEQPPLSVKGVEEPVRTWLVVKALPQAQRQEPRGVEGLHTRMVGRDAELTLLLEALQRTVLEGRGSAMTVVGEAGLGKSRLLAEFEHHIDAQTVWLLLGRANPRSASERFGLLRDMLTRHLQICENEPAASARGKLVTQLSPLLSEHGQAPVHLLGLLAGLDFSDSPHVKELLGDESKLLMRTFDAAVLWLRQLGRSRPVVVVLDDLHWADADSIDLVHHLMREAADVPQLCLTLTRPTLFEQHSPWMRDVAHHSLMDLKPLDHVRSQELAGSLLQRIVEVPDALRALVIDSADGNPFYMEELVRMFIDDGVVVVEPEGWRVQPDGLLQAKVPPTLTGVLQARLDALAANEHRALQQAAVVGHVFWEQALAAIDPAAPDCLPSLLRKDLVVAHDAVGLDGSREYSFKHHLLHQVTYDSVLKAHKREGHGRVGAFWSLRAEVSGPKEVDPAKCRALAEAQHHRCRSDPQAYVGWFDQQFSHYQDAYAAQALRPLTEELVEVCERHFGPEHPETAKALTNLAIMNLMQGRLEQAEPLLRRATALQERSLHADHPDSARTLVALGCFHENRGELVEAEPCFRRALEIRLRTLGSDHPRTLDSVDNLAKVILELDRLDEAETLLRQVLSWREHHYGPEHPDTAFALTALAEALSKKGDQVSAEPLLRRALAVQQRNLPPDHPETGLSMWHLAEALRALQRYDEAEALARRTLQMWEAALGAEHGWIAWCLICLAEVRLVQGDAAETIELTQRALRVLEKQFSPAHAVLASTPALLARAYLTIGPPQEATALLQQATDTHKPSGADAPATAAELQQEHSASANQAPSNIRCAASLLMLRDGRRGTEVLLMRRPERGDNDFRSGMCVFPGGVLDRADAQAHALCFGLDDATASARLGLAQGGLDYFIAALRESFEEVGLLFACHPDGRAIDMAAHADSLRNWRSRLHRGETTIAQLCQAMGWRLDLRDMAYFAHWLTPVIRPKRFDTRFFVRVVPAGQQATPDFGEALELLWLTPDEALDPARGLKLLSVTQKVLHSIRGWSSARAGFEQALALRGVRRIFPRMALGRHGPRFVIDEDAAYDEVARLDPEGRGDVRCELDPGDVVQLSARLWRISGVEGNAYLVADTSRTGSVIIDANADDAAQVQALRALAVAPVMHILITRIQDAQVAALRAHWPEAQCATAPAPGQVFNIGTDSSLRLTTAGTGRLACVLQEEGIALGEAVDMAAGAIEWLAPLHGFMRRMAPG